MKKGDATVTPEELKALTIREGGKLLKVVEKLNGVAMILIMASNEGGDNLELHITTNLKPYNQQVFLMQHALETIIEQKGKAKIEEV